MLFIIYFNFKVSKANLDIFYISFESVFYQKKYTLNNYYWAFVNAILFICPNR